MRPSIWYRRQPTVRWEGPAPMHSMERVLSMAANPTTAPSAIGPPEPVEIPACPADREARTHALLQAFDERVLVMDGATGTALQRLTLTAADFGGPDLEGCNE